MSTKSNSTLLQFLQKFSVEDWKGLLKYAEAPMGVRRKEILALFKALSPTLFNGKAMPEKPWLYRQLFGAGAFDDHRLRMTFSLSYKLALEYLTLKDFLNDENAFGLRQTAVLRKRRLPRQAGRILEKAGNANKLNSFQDAEQFEHRYRHALESYQVRMQEEEPADQHLQQLSDHLDIAYLGRKLWQSCFLLSHQVRSGVQYNFGLLKAALEGIEHTQALEQKGIAIYYYCYMALTQENQPAHYARFKELLLESDHLFPREELRDLYILAINFCTRQYNAGNPSFLREQFDLYQKGLDKAYFLVEGELSQYTYHNAATLALVLKELDWLAHFIHHYKAYLSPVHRESLYSFNQARLLYTRKDYGQALQLLQKAEYKDLLLGLAAKTLQLKIYFELGEYDLLESHLQAFNIFLQRKKQLGYHRENYRNTIRFARKMLELGPYNREGRVTLRNEVLRASALAEKEWLLERLSAET